MLVLSALAAALVGAALPPPAPGARPMPFRQLVATRYPKGAPLPPEAAPPAETKHPLPANLPTKFFSHQPQVDPDTKVAQAIPDGKGHWWLATNVGAYLTDGDQWWHPIDHRDGMPFITLNSLHLAPNGDLWGATPEGAWRLRDGNFRYFWGTRYLPGNHVSRIWTDAKGATWLDTDGGVARIEEKPMTLKEKAAHFEAINLARHNRRGYVSGSDLKTPGDPDKGFVLEASDNDGLWTALYIGAESLRWAVTKDPEAKRLAKRSMDALLDLERLTGIPGYPARAVVTDEELKAGVTGFNPDETVRTGNPDKIWFRSPVEKNVWCKSDTSSDEIDGHYFAWLLYYDLVADDPEKTRVAAACRRVTDYILKNDFTLVDYNGKRTLWGMWTPKALNEDPRWMEERGLNSAEMLCFLKVAAHICKEPRYEAIYDELIRKHHFLTNTLLYRRDVRWWEINHSDDELAYVVYYPLLLLEKDPARRRILVQAVARTWEDSPEQQTIKAERSPFYNFLYGGGTGNYCDPEAAIQTLEEWPWELINHDTKNSHRHDVTVRRAALARNRASLSRVVSPAERRVMRWNGSPWEADSGGGGRSEEDAAAFLLPYWLGVYHGYIDKDR